MAVDAFLYRQHQAEKKKKIKQKLGGTFNYYVITRNNYYHHLPSCSHWFNFGGSLHPLERSKLNVQNLNSTPCPPTTTTFIPTPQKTVKSIILWFYSQLSSAPVNTTKKC